MKSKFTKVVVAGSIIVGTMANLRADLSKYVPEASKVMLSVNLKSLSEKIQNGEFIKEEAVADSQEAYNELLAKIGITEGELPQEVKIFFVDEKNWGILAKTDISPSKLESIIKKGMEESKKDGKDVSFSKETIAGKECFVLKENKKDEPQMSMIPMPKMDDTAIITYLEKDVVFMTAKDVFEKQGSQIGKTSIKNNATLMTRGKNIDNNGLLSMIFSLPKIEAPKQGQPPTMLDMFGVTPMIRGIEGGALSFNLVGTDTVAMKIVLDCETVMKSTNLENMAKGGLSMQMMEFQSNPDLYNAVQKALVISRSEKQFIVNINFNKELSDKIKAFESEKKKNKGIQRSR